MKTPFVFIPVFLGAIALTPQSARAFCLNQEVTASLEQDAAPDEEAFASSGPARSDSEFRLEVDLDDLTGLGASADEAETEMMDAETLAEGEEFVPVHQREYETRDDYLDAMATELNRCEE